MEQINAFVIITVYSKSTIPTLLLITYRFNTQPKPGHIQSAYYYSIYHTCIWYDFFLSDFALLFLLGCCDPAGTPVTYLSTFKVPINDI